MTAKSTFSLHWDNTYTSLTGREGYISNLYQYKWYNWCYYIEHKEQLPFNQELLGQVIGPATGSGNDMEQWILKSNGSVVHRRTLHPLHTDELHSPEEHKKQNIFGALIEKRWGTSINPPLISITINEKTGEENEDKDE